MMTASEMPGQGFWQNSGYHNCLLCIAQHLYLLGDESEQHDNKPNSDDDAEGAPSEAASGIRQAIVDYLANL